MVGRDIPRTTVHGRPVLVLGLLASALAPKVTLAAQPVFLVDQAYTCKVESKGQPSALYFASDGGLVLAVPRSAPGATSLEFETSTVARWARREREPGMDLVSLAYQGMLDHRAGRISPLAAREANPPAARPEGFLLRADPGVRGAFSIYLPGPPSGNWVWQQECQPDMNTANSQVLRQNLAGIRDKAVKLTPEVVAAQARFDEKYGRARSSDDVERILHQWIGHVAELKAHPSPNCRPYVPGQENMLDHQLKYFNKLREYMHPKHSDWQKWGLNYGRSAEVTLDLLRKCSGRADARR